MQRTGGQVQINWIKKWIPVQKEWAEKAGPGFDLGPNGPKVEAIQQLENAA